MGLCQYKVGYLSLKGCGDQVIAQCAFCNQGVCVRHMRTVENASACLSCYMERVPDQQDEEAKKHRPEDEPEDEEMEQERSRRGAYTRYGYGPRYYGTFDDTTRETSRAAAPLAAADFQDS